MVTVLIGHQFQMHADLRWARCYRKFEFRQARGYSRLDYLFPVYTKVFCEFFVIRLFLVRISQYRTCHGDLSDDFLYTVA